MHRQHLPKVMVSMAHGRSLAEVLNTVVEGMAQCNNVVLARIWLVEPGDLCSECRMRPESPDQTRCLHLVASGANPADPEDVHRRLNGGFRRFPMGVRKIGRVAMTGEPLLLADVRGDEKSVAEPNWIQRERVKTVVAQPLVFAREVRGVLDLLDSGVLSEEDVPWWRVFADHAAVRIANARAQEEIAFPKERLESVPGLAPALESGNLRPR